MEAQEYCESLRSELAGWKAKVHDMVGKFDHLPSDDKVKVGPLVDELHTVIEEHTSKMEKLSSECPADWGLEKRKNGRFAGLRKVWKALGDYHFWYRPHL
jgi:hypothetical protein